MPGVAEGPSGEVPVAVVTGGGSGIGRACARILSDRGFAVATLDLDPATAKQTADELAGPALGLAVDVSSREDVHGAIGSVIDQFGRLEVLVTAAGHLDFSPLETMSEAMFDRMVNVHVKGTFLAVQAVLPTMRERGYGRIICISSVGARQGHALACHYTAAKAGIVGFANSACQELGPLGVTINCVLPGAVDTPMLARRATEVPQTTQGRPPTTPVGHIGTPEDIAHVVAFLASPESRYVTGSSIVVSGGAYS